MATRLGLYCRALRFCGERKLASLTEDVPTRHYLDEVWSDNFVRKVLEMGLWNFAIRSARLDYTGAVVPEFGYSHAFEKPSDWVRTAALCGDDRFSVPLINVADEGGYWYADEAELFVRLVSDGAEYGSDLSIWPESVEEYAGCRMAVEINPRLTNSRTDTADLKDERKRLLSDARAKDGMNQAPSFRQPGSWAASRGGRGRGERGNPGSLIG